MINDIAQASYTALVNLWQGFLNFLPTFLGGLIVFLIGIIIGKGLAQLVEKIIGALKIDALLEKAGVREITDKAGIALNSGYFLGQLTKWLIILSFLIAACNIWGLSAVGDFVKSVVGYLPNVIVAILILIIAIIVGDYVGKFVKASVTGAGLKTQTSLAAITRWVFYIFGILAALSQLKVATYIINTLFTGIVAMLAVAGGLAFGLGGKDLAREILEKIRGAVENK